MMTVYLPVNEALLTDYLKYLFPTEKGSSCLKVSGACSFGKLLIANITTSDHPVSVPEGDNVIKLHIPKQDCTQDLADKFLYFTKGSVCRLNAALKAVFDMDFHDYYQRGIDKGYQKKDIIDAFIISRKLCSVDPGDALHKRTYRHEMKKHQNRARYLSRKANYIQESLDTSGLNNNTEL